ILFGFGALKGLGEEVENLGAKKALLVTDKVMEKTGIVSKVSAHLDGLGYDIFDEVEPEPRVEVAEAVARKVRSSPYDLVLEGGVRSIWRSSRPAWRRTRERREVSWGQDSSGGRHFPR